MFKINTLALITLVVALNFCCNAFHLPRHLQPTRITKTTFFATRVAPNVDNGLVDASCTSDLVDIKFSDKSSYRFHAQWLRDACRDETYVRNAAGEKILQKTLLVAGSPAIASSASVSSEGKRLEVVIDNELCTFDVDLLRAYAPKVAMPLTTSKADTIDELAWLRPYSGVPTASAADPATLKLWTATTGISDIPSISWEEAMTPAGNLQLLREVLGGAGCFKITAAPNPSVTTLYDLTKFCFNGLQKDPSREEPNWVIVRKESAASVSYNPSTRLNNHSDQSLPNHGTPALLLVMHYAKGWGANTLVDSFAAAEDLRKNNPEAFELLSTYGNDQERDLLASRQDAHQEHTESLCLTSAAPIIQLDGQGRIKRVQYNEVFRSPSSVPFDKFKAWYSAYLTFAGMLESAEFEREVPMKAGDFMVFNNWRVLHGRAGSHVQDIGKVSPDRMLTGGTITRENAFSRARTLLREVEGVQLYGPHAFTA